VSGLGAEDQVAEQCPVCHALVATGSRFCHRCGTPLSRSGDVPAGGGARSDQASERRVATCLHCDLVDSTAMSQALDAEAGHEMLAGYHAAVADRVAAFGGRVERMKGDDVLAVFGAGRVHEDDPERAVRAALGIVEAVAALPAPHPDLPVMVRVGITTGQLIITVGATVDGASVTVDGPSVNVAARLQSAAAPGTILVDDATFEATRRIIRFAPARPVDAKGVADPVPAHQVLEALYRYRADLPLDLDVPLVGRDLQLRQLTTAFDHVARSSSMELVTLIGDPGAGKTRMVAELFAAVPQGVVCKVGRVPPYGESTGFSAIADIVKAHADIYDSDAPEVVASKLAEAVAGMADGDRVHPLLLALLRAEGGVASLEDSFVAWREFLEHLAVASPAVVAIEDIHQADPELLRFLLELTEIAPTVPLLVVVTARPDLLTTRPDWAASLRNQTHVDLPPLADEETRQLLRHLIGGVALPPQTEGAILERAGGNPLFAAEFARMLRDRELIEPLTNERARPPVEITLPQTVQGVIAARLDILEGHARGVIQDAAVVGRVFWSGAVASLSGRPEADVRRDLKALVTLSVVRHVGRSSLSGQAEYAFTHVLLRDAAYEQLRKPARASKHLAAADWLEQWMSAGVDELAEVLAYHCDTALALAVQAGDERLAAECRSRLMRCWLHAADAAEAVAAWAKALAHVGAACALAESTPALASELPSLVARRGRLERRLGHLEESAGGPDRGRWGSPDAAVPAGRHMHRPSTEMTTPKVRPAAELWEVLISVDRTFYDADLVDDPLPEPATQRRVALLQPTALIGRGRDVAVDLRDPLDPAVSREHARLHRSQDGWTVTQVSPNNPTYLNGVTPLPYGEPVPIAEGEYLNMGGWTRITVRRARG